MRTLYTLLIRVYYIVVLISSLFNKKAKDWIVGRKNQEKSIKEVVTQWQNHPIIWIHAASYGEFEMAKPIIQAIQKKEVKTRFVVSFYSPSGFKNISLDQDTFLKIYLPLDLPSNQSKLIEIIDPQAVIFIKYEFWFNFLKSLNDAEIPYYFTSLHLNKSSYLLKTFFSAFKQQLLKAKTIFCHNALSFEILKDNGFQNLKIFGDTRIEQVEKNKRENKLDIKFNNDLTTIVFGSITEYEMSHIVAFCNKNKNFNYIIATHDVSKLYLHSLSQKLASPSALFSTLENSTTDSKIILVDTYGDLRFLYKNAHLAYIGAGFEKGPHNVLEPLVYGIPVVIGKNIRKFPMAQYLKELELIFVLDKIRDIYKIPDILSEIDQSSFSSKSQKFFNENRTNIEELVNSLTLSIDK